MLDYAANGTSYWKMDSLRQSAAETAQKNGKSLDDEILKLINSDDVSQIDLYWTRVEEKLKSSNVRLIFVADSVPSELRRLVEFLNEQMTSVEVLAVEAKQFVGEGVSAIVPRLLGMTETAREVKRQSNKPLTNREEMLSKCPPDTRQFFIYLMDTAEKQKHLINWGVSGFSVRVAIPGIDFLASIAYGYPPDIFQLFFSHLPFSDEKIATLRKELLETGIFKSSPKMLIAHVTQDNLQHAIKSYELMERRVIELAKDQ